MKAIKLLLLAIVLVGAVIGLLYINSDSDKIKEPEFTSAQANEWKEKINELCKDENWSTSGYSRIETGIHTDNVVSDGDLINDEEERTLNKYLFSCASSYLLESADKHFKQESYSDEKIENYESAIRFMKEAVRRFGANSNLTEVTNMILSYNQIKRSLGFNSNAVYSRPLKSFSCSSVVVIQNKIRGMKYYKSHFCNNSSIKSRVNNLAADRDRAEQKYYDNLVLEIEKNYKSTGRIEELLDDQIHFNEISTNNSAIVRLTNFVNNPDN